MLAAKVEQLTAEVAAWAARLGGQRELWAAWLAWRRGMRNRARNRRRAIMQLTAMVRRRRKVQISCRDVGRCSSSVFERWLLILAAHVWIVTFEERVVCVENQTLVWNRGFGPGLEAVPVLNGRS
jgi:hypothetical protein